MASQKIVIEGVTYLRSRDAACMVQLAPDYVSRLSRAELINGKLIDGLWFVELASLKSFIVEQARQKEAALPA